MKKLFLLIMVFGLSVYISKAVDEECLYDISTSCPEGGYIGFESMLDSNSSGVFKSTLVYIDTCNLKDLNGNSMDSDSICTYLIDNEPILKKENRYYSNEFFQIRFKIFPFDTNGINLDLLSYLTIENFKTQLSDLKSIFEDLEDITGTIRFYPYLNKHRSFSKSMIDSCYYYITLSNIVNTLEIEETINSYDDIVQCRYQSDISVPTSIGYKELSKFLLYPNPATENITLDLDRNVENIKIISSTGETYYEFSNSEIKNINVNRQMSMNVYHYPSGVYFVIIDNKYYNKFVIER